MSDLVSKLTDKKLLLKNLGLNFLAKVLPLILGIILIPLLLNRMGEAQFGVITYVWILIGYASIFDLGLSSAMIKVISAEIGLGRVRTIPAYLSSAFGVLIILGCSLSIILLVISTAFTNIIPEYEGILKADLIHVIQLVSAFVPFVVLSSGIVALFSSYQRFDVISKVQAFGGVLNYSLPLLTILIWPESSLFKVAFSIVIGRFIVFLLWCFNTILFYKKYQFKVYKWRLTFTKELYKVGGPVTVSMIVSSVIQYIDQFFVVGKLGPKESAYYNTPLEMVNKANLIPLTLMNVLFPAFSSLDSVKSDYQRSLFEKGQYVIMLSLIIPLIIGIIFAQDLLFIWTKNLTFSQEAAPLFQVFIVGISLKVLLYNKIALLYSQSKQIAVMKLHIFEMLLYVSVLILFNSYATVFVIALIRLGRNIVDYLGVSYITVYKNKQLTKTTLVEIVFILSTLVFWYLFR